MAIHTWTLFDGNSEVVISARGGVVRDWVIHDKEGDIHVLDGYRNDKENAQGSGAYNAVLAPWSNRIKDARYTFNGCEYDLGAASDGSREALHGLICDADFISVYRSDRNIKITTIVQPCPGYPWTVEVDIIYHLRHHTHSELSMHISVANVCEDIAPVTLGWHPYIRYQGGTAEQATLRLGAKTRIRSDKKLIPLDGPEAFEPASDVPSSTLFEIKGPRNLDDAFSELVDMGDGRAQAELIHPNGDVTTLEMLLPAHGDPKGCGVFHIFTGEPLEKRPCEAIAIEPCLTMTNAFNRDECAEFIALEPGKSQDLFATISHRISTTSE
ncbi:MAG: hypothetical protein Q4P66_05475 [Actinomycetaceae bacterium]|nr:hypothetical protein [Actinomycetaceae bacterium]